MLNDQTMDEIDVARKTLEVSRSKFFRFLSSSFLDYIKSFNSEMKEPSLRDHLMRNFQQED